MWGSSPLEANSSEAWSPVAVARLGLTILALAAILNLIERIIVAIKVLQPQLFYPTAPPFPAHRCPLPPSPPGP